MSGSRSEWGRTAGLRDAEHRKVLRELQAITRKAYTPTYIGIVRSFGDVWNKAITRLEEHNR